MAKPRPRMVVAMTQVYLEGAFAKLEAAAKKVVAAVAEGDMLRTQMAIVRRLAKHEPLNVIALAGENRQPRAGDGQVRNNVKAFTTLRLRSAQAPAQETPKKYVSVPLCFLAGGSSWKDCWRNRLFSLAIAKGLECSYERPEGTVMSLLTRRRFSIT